MLEIPLVDISPTHPNAMSTVRRTAGINTPPEPRHFSTPPHCLSPSHHSLSCTAWRAGPSPQSLVHRSHPRARRARGRRRPRPGRAAPPLLSSLAATSSPYAPHSPAPFPLWFVHRIGAGASPELEHGPGRGAARRRRLEPPGHAPFVQQASPSRRRRSASPAHPPEPPR